MVRDIALAVLVLAILIAFISITTRVFRGIKTNFKTSGEKK